MAASTLALVGVDSTSTASLVSYDMRSSNSSAIQYVGIGNGSTLAEPRLIDVKLDIKGIGATGNDRANISIKHVVQDKDANTFVGSVSATLSLPRTPEWTPAMTVSLLKQLADYLGGESENVVGKTTTSGFPVRWAQLIVP